MFDIQGLNIYLIGMMGCGKSTIGPLLAAELGYSFEDTDITLAKYCTKTFETFQTLDYSFEATQLSASELSELAAKIITKLFQTVGEPEFRKIETKVLATVSAKTKLVVATGGGIATKGENWNHLSQGLVIWLDPSVDLLVERLKGDTSRPLLATSEDLQSKLLKRLLAKHFPTMYRCLMTIQLRSKLKHILAERRPWYKKAHIHMPFTTKLSHKEIVDLLIKLIKH